MSTPAPLAELIRKKYPDAYNNIADYDLEQKWLTKYPEYGKNPQVSLTPKPTGEQFMKENQLDPFNRQANEFLLGGASGASTLPQTLNPVSDALTPPKTKDEWATKVAGAFFPEIPIARGLYGLGKQLFSGQQPGESTEDVAARRANALGQTAGTAAPLIVGEGVNAARTSAVPAARATGQLASRVARDPITGTLKPGAVTTGKVLGAAGGGLAGYLGGSELGGRVGGDVYGSYTGSAGGLYGAVKGAKAGYSAGPAIMDWAIPSRAGTFEPFTPIPGGEAVPVSRSPVPGGYGRKPVAPPPVPEPPLGSPANPAYHSKLPTRLPPELRGDPFAPTSTSAGASLPSAEEFYGHEADVRMALLKQAAERGDVSPSNPFRDPFMSKLPTRLTAAQRGDPFSPASPEDIATDPFSPSRSGGDIPRPFTPVIATPEEYTTAGTGTLPQLLRVLKIEAENAGLYSAARGKVGRKINYQERIGGAISKPTPSAPLPETPSAVRSSTGFTEEGLPERRAEPQPPTIPRQRRIVPPEEATPPPGQPEQRKTTYELRKGAMETEEERAAKSMGSVESMKKVGQLTPAQELAKKLFPSSGGELTKLTPEQRAEVDRIGRAQGGKR